MGTLEALVVVDQLSKQAALVAHGLAPARNTSSIAFGVFGVFGSFAQPRGQHRVSMRADHHADQPAQFF